MIWAIKDHAISHTFFDEGAAAFFLPQLTSGEDKKEKTSQTDTPELVEVSPFKRTKYALDPTPGGGGGRGRILEGQAAPSCEGGVEVMGVALGPDWHADLKMAGKKMDCVSLCVWL